MCAYVYIIKRFFDLFDQCRRKHEICHAKCHCSIKASRTEGGRTDEQINLRVQQLNFASKKMRRNGLMAESEKPENTNTCPSIPLLALLSTLIPLFSPLLPPTSSPLPFLPSCFFFPPFPFFGPDLSSPM